MKHEDLRRLKELKQKGIITEEEFEKRKQKLIEMKQHHHFPIFHHGDPHHESKTYHHGHKPKKRILAGVMGILLGATGIHNFYLAHYMRGAIQLLITVLSVGLFWYIPAIFGAIEGILILTKVIDEDAHGIELK